LFDQNHRAPSLGHVAQTIEATVAPSDPGRRRAGQYMTPDWAAEAIVAHYFNDLTLGDYVLEPSCGEGAFLRALPDHVPACGIELDPLLADRARSTSGRPVLVGDFTTTAPPRSPTVIMGNPPFQVHLVERFLDRARVLLPEDGRVGFILPCSVFQTASTVARLSKHWGIQQDMLPRNLFRRLSIPICFAQFRRGSDRRLIGFALYGEANSVGAMKTRYRQLLRQGQRSVWVAVAQAALERLGGSASLSQIYEEIDGAQPTANRFWQAKIRQVLQRIAVNVGRGHWALP